MSEPLEAFETRLLRRVAKAVEAGEVPADLLTELQAEIDTAKGIPQEEGHARAVRDIAETLGIPVDQVEQGLNALEGHPTVARELLMREIAERWLEGQKLAYRRVWE